MTLDQFKQVWARAAAKAAAREKDYSALDAAAGGDGDHGEAIVAATKALAAAQGADFKSLLSDMVEHLESDVSGSTSSLYGTLFEGMADAVDPGVTALDAAGIADLFAAGLEELGFATKAKVGDKTFMDALIPAIEALKAHAADRRREGRLRGDRADAGPLRARQEPRRALHRPDRRGRREQRGYLGVLYLTTTGGGQPPPNPLKEERLT